MSRLKWALRAGTERVVQPTDSRSQVGFCVAPEGVLLKGREEVRACRRIAVLRVGRGRQSMRNRLLRVAAVLSTVAATALAGGASLKGF